MDVKRADNFWQYIVDVYSDPETDELKITDDKNGMIDKYCADTYFDKNFIADLFEKEFVPRLPFSKLTSKQKQSVEDALKVMRCKEKTNKIIDKKLDSMIWKFVIKSCRSGGKKVSKISVSSLDWNNFTQAHGLVETRASYYIERLTSVLIPNLQMAEVSEMKKLNLYFALDEPVPADLLETLKINFKVATDDNYRLVSYHRRVKDDYDGKKRFTPEEDAQIWEYLKKIIRNSKTNKLEQVKLTPSSWETFVTSTKSKRQLNVINIRYNKFLRDKLHTSDFGTQEKLELHWALSIKVPAEAMEMYEATHHVELDDERFVVKFWDKTAGEKDESDTEITTTDDSGSDLNDSETETTEENVDTQQNIAEKRAPSDSVPEGVPDLKRGKLSGQQMSGTRLLSSLKKLIKSLPNGKYEDCVRLIDEKLELLMVEDKSIPVECIKLVIEKICN